MDALMLQWKTDVFDKADEVDPEPRYDWEGVAVGYALGKGLTIEEAHEFALALLKKKWL